MIKNIAKQSDGLWTDILLFALPVAASNMVQQLFNSADTAVVGQFAGNLELAAMGSTSVVVTLYITVFSGFAVGANVVIARLVGARAKDDLPRAMYTVLVSAVVLGVLLTVLGQLTVTPILQIMSTPENIIASARRYLRIYLLGTVFQMLYNFESAALRASGDTKRPLICLILSGVLNVGLNLFFVIVWDMGVAGVAIATVLSGAVSALLLLVYLLHGNSELKLSRQHMKLDGQLAKAIMRIGLPAAIQGILFNAANIIIQTGVNVFGDSVISGSSIGITAEVFIYHLICGFGQASVTFNGQYFGAGQLARCWANTRSCLLLGCLLTEAFAGVLLLCRAPFVGIFTPDVQVGACAMLRMQCVLMFEVFNLIIEVMSGALRGLGYSVTPAALSAVFVCGLRIAWVFVVFPHAQTFQMLMAVYPASWGAAALTISAAYLIVKRKLAAQAAAADCGGG